MSTSQKSNIRSRWYRANEKPLESDSSPKTNADPIGEISIQENEKLTDDLSSAKPPAFNEKENRQSRNSNRNHDRRRNSSRNRDDSKGSSDRPPRSPKDNKNRNAKQNSKRRKPPEGRDNQNPKRKDRSQNKDRPNHKDRRGKSQKKLLSLRNQN